jgi:hypothetical protein
MQKKKKGKNNMENKNELEVKKDENFIVPSGQLEIDTEDLEGLTISFDKVSIPSGGGTMWELPGMENPDEPEYNKEIEGVIVDHYPVNAFFENEYTGEIVPPTCSSMDGKLGIGNPGGMCANCPLNKYGSADDGKGKKCKNLRRIYILRSGEILPLLVTLPPTSIKNFSDYISKRIVTKGMKACDVVTKMTLTVEKSQTGIKYSKVQFSIARTLRPEEKKVMREFSNNIKQTTRLQRVDETDNSVLD